MDEQHVQEDRRDVLATAAHLTRRSATSGGAGTIRHFHHMFHLRVMLPTSRDRSVSGVRKRRNPAEIETPQEERSNGKDR